ncbi:conserved Plasmodium protein, unknown function [Plasmodium gallinaceum]|uniref:Methyltransferase n=1 Tax=Plasmodium gallinaceum TaxID=5849 RepID=A0A1J1H0E1_PLAGA|nr:conserved Plasmodium protein, unknown function [Plasmodium gallinaceum]CRG98164.1 conserved Plasmodium protein, unknown function [Plasmodium gallinaceum]
MEILPAGYSDFRNKNYWNRFFNILDKKNFEWYGNYEDIKNIIYECIRNRFNYSNNSDEKDNLSLKRINKNCLLINAGCGNSNISYEFFEDGFQNIINLDYSEVVIEKMCKKYGDKMRFINIDMSDTESFDKVLENLEEEKIKNKNDYKIFFDKAFLDAYLSCEESEEEVCKKNAKNYFSLIFKYLNIGDVFIIITLAQHYIIKEVVRNIYNQYIKLEIIPFLIKKDTNQFKYHPYVFAFYKSNEKNDYTAKFINLQKNMKVVSIWKLPQEIKQTQENLNLHIFKKGKRIILDIFNQKINKCEYNIIIYDSNNLDIKYNTVLIVIPIGYEFHSLYSTSEGNEELAKKAQTKRLLLVMKSNFLVKENKEIDEKEDIKKKNDIYQNNVTENPNFQDDNKVNMNNLIKCNSDKNTNIDSNDHIKISSDNNKNIPSNISQSKCSENSKVYSDAMLNNNVHNELYEDRNSINILLDSIKNDLKNILNDLALPNSNEFPIMVLNENIKNCKIISHEKSNYSTSIIIRDILITDEFILENFNGNKKIKKKKKKNSLDKKDDIIFLMEKNKKEKEIYFKNKEIYKRQMIFSYDPLTVQSELIYTKKDDQQINFEYIESASQYHIYFCCSFFFLIDPNFLKENNFINICILGGGTNVLSNIIKVIFCDFYLYFDIIEIDETVKKFYPLFSNETISNEKHVTNYIINDSYEYIRNSNKTQFYDIIFLDINNSQNSYLKINDCELYITCPHIKFLNKEIIVSIKNIMKEDGILVINLLTRDYNAKKYIYNFFKILFSSVTVISSNKKEINEVLICKKTDITKEKISSFKSNLVEMIKNNYDKWFLNFDLEEFIKNIKIL